MKNYVDAMTPNVPRYLQVNKSLLRNAKALGLGLDEVILYAKICNRAQLSCANGRVDDYGRIYVTYSRMEYVEETGCSKGFAIKAFRALIQAGLTVEGSIVLAAPLRTASIPSGGVSPLGTARWMISVRGVWST